MLIKVRIKKSAKICVTILIESQQHTYGAVPTPNGWYLKQIIKGGMDVMSNEEHLARLTDNGGNPVLVWREENTNRLRIVYV